MTAYVSPIANQNLPDFGLFGQRGTMTKTIEPGTNWDEVFKHLIQFFGCY